MFLVGGMAHASTRGACVSGREAGQVGETGILELETATGAAGGKGIYVWAISSDSITDEANEFGIGIFSSSFIDTGSTFISPHTSFSTVLQTVARQGRDANGIVPNATVGDWFPQRNFLTGYKELFVPPGMFFTIRRAVTGQDANFDVCFTEIP